MIEITNLSPFLRTPYLLIFLATSCVIASSCNPTTDVSKPPAETPPTNLTTDLPDELALVLDAHGGLASWREQRTLFYTISSHPATQGEQQLVDLRDRRERVIQPAKDDGAPVEMGFDGQHHWVKADSSFRGNPLFYHNLMFYFYAMPWVLADPGINYTAAEPLTFAGTTYPGLLISYDDGIGYSPKDNYRLHYDPETNRMRWLGYTVTARTGETSDKFSWIEYPTWTAHAEVELPDSLVWYSTEANLPVKPRNIRYFTQTELSPSPAPAERFAMPPGGRAVE